MQCESCDCIQQCRLFYGNSKTFLPKFRSNMNENGFKMDLIFHVLFALWRDNIDAISQPNIGYGYAFFDLVKSQCEPSDLHSTI
jgi:hypothetical protein